MLPLESELSSHWPTGAWHDVSVVLAVSGGADSVALLRAMARLKPAGSSRLWVAHFNHGWRGPAADQDAAFVAELAAELGIGCRLGGPAEKSVPQATPDGLEAAGRAARYRFLEEVAAEVGARYLVTAHTADDQAETILHRIFRGTGLAGLAGIPRVRPLNPSLSLIRPLLTVRRAELRVYLQALGQPWHEDATNAETDATRNWIRQVLLPLVQQKINPGAVEAALRLGQQAQEVQTLVDALVENLIERLPPASPATDNMETGNQSGAGVAELKIDGRVLAKESRYLVRELLKRLWRRQGWPEQAMGFDEWDSLAALLQTDISAPARDYPGGVRAEKNGAELRLTLPHPALSQRERD